MTTRTPFLRVVRSAEEPLGLFFRPGHNDHRVLCQLLSEGRSAMSGVVLDPGLVGPQGELRWEARQRNLWAVLDSRMMELATASGFTEQRAALPWAGERPHAPADLSGRSGEAVMDSLAEFVAQHGFSAVLTPTHYLARGAQDPWLDVDLALTRALRWKLDVRGCDSVALYYVLAVPTNVFHDATQRTAFKAHLQSVEIDGIWLRVHPFGADSGHVTLQRYIQGCRDMHALSLPLVAEKTGSIGLPLLAFGAIGGLESGVSSGEKFDFGRLSRPPQAVNKGFAPHARVYLPGLGVFLNRDAARVFFENRTLRTYFGCHDPACCRRSVQDTIGDPRRHFVFTRMEEIGAIGQVPVQLRPNQYLDTMLRPATDRLGRALQADLNEEVRMRLEKERRKLDGWRHTLGEMFRTQPLITSSATPERRAAWRRGA
jgi:hypothetical protein